MPRKSCCCNQPPLEGSCCRPIYNGCVGKKYEFSFLVKIKYPCWKDFQYTQNNFVCPNNPAVTHPIQNNFETFRVTVNYRIAEPAYQNIPFDSQLLTFYSPMRTRCEDIEPPSPVVNCGDAEGSPASSVTGFPVCSEITGSYPGKRCFNSPYFWPCASSTFSPSDYTTYPDDCNFGCGCFNGKYAKCNFSELRSCDEVCNDGLEGGVYRCGNQPTLYAYLPGQIPECGPDPFGNPQTPIIVNEPNEPNYFWPNCYHSWLLQKPNFGFVPTNTYQLICPPIGPFLNNCSGCIITNHGEMDVSNIPDSYTIQFIPDQSVLEQTDPNYTPKVQPKLLHFWVGCNKDGVFAGNAGNPVIGYTTSTNGDVYNIGIKMGFGYKAEFCCDAGSGTGPNPNNPGRCDNIEVVDIPYREFDYIDFFGVSGRATQGPTVLMLYGRASLPNDPMNLCIPTSTQNVPNLSCSPFTCESGDAYYDDYNACFKGKPDLSLHVSDPQDPFNPPNPNLWIYNDYCFGTIQGEIGSGSGIDWPLCNHIKFDYRIDVSRIL